MFSLPSCPAGMPDPLEVLRGKSFGEFCTDTCLPVAVQWKVGRALDPSAWFQQETLSLFLFSCSVSYYGITYAATENEVSLVKSWANMEQKMLYTKWVYSTYLKLFTGMGPLSLPRTNCVSMSTAVHKFLASSVTNCVVRSIRAFFKSFKPWKSNSSFWIKSWAMMAYFKKGRFLFIETERPTSCFWSRIKKLLLFIPACKEKW